MAEYPNWFAQTAQNNFDTYLAEYKGKPNLRFLQLGVFTGDATVWLCNNILTDDTSTVEFTELQTSAVEEKRNSYGGWIRVQSKFF